MVPILAKNLAQRESIHVAWFQFLTLFFIKIFWVKVFFYLFEIWVLFKNVMKMMMKLGEKDVISYLKNVEIVRLYAMINF
jgi:hypothetical protein